MFNINFLCSYTEFSLCSYNHLQHTWPFAWCVSLICGRLDSAKQLDSLQLQLHVMAEQRDNALLQLSSAQETIASYATSLSNLQMVLEQFQAGEVTGLLMSCADRRPVCVDTFQVGSNSPKERLWALLWPPSRAGHYILPLWFLFFFHSFLFLPYSQRPQLGYLHTSTHDVALVRI